MDRSLSFHLFFHLSRQASLVPCRRSHLSVKGESRVRSRERDSLKGRRRAPRVNLPRLCLPRLCLARATRGRRREAKPGIPPGEFRPGSFSRRHAAVPFSFSHVRRTPGHPVDCPTAGRFGGHRRDAFQCK